MGFRFHKSIGVIPGLRINLSKTGISASVGGKGATVNVSPKGITGTAGLPGTGLSYRKSLTPTGLELARRSRWSKWWLLLIVVAAAFAFFWLRREGETVISGAAPTELTVSTTTANCRAGPVRTAAVQAKLARGATVRELARDGNWVRVSSGGSECWVSSRTVKRAN